ncbi:MAG: NAD(P)H-dependent oxidoreductase [Actinomycetota bacterium]|nr:NAD(P)H-dependent oxidoreductase [Actinomycetota bacterium]
MSDINFEGQRRFQVLGISGSASKNSYNTHLLNAIGKMLPSNVDFKLFEGLTSLPFYTPEIDTDQDRPAIAQTLRDAIRGADAVIIAAPEYNHSVTAVIKNAIDWASRPYGAHSLVRKPILPISASMSILGGVRGQIHLRDILHSTESNVVARPEVFVASAHTKFNEDHELVDQETINVLKLAVDSLVSHAGLQA